MKRQEVIRMTMLIEDHARVLGVRGKTVARLKAVDIETMEDLADAPIDLIVRNLRCTVERAKVLINRAKRAARHPDRLDRAAYLIA